MAAHVTYVLHSRRKAPTLYETLLRDLVDEASHDQDIIGVLLTGSLARGDALPGTDLDLRYILAAGLNRLPAREIRDNVLVERDYADEESAETKLRTHPMNLYAYLDGRVLYDPRGALARLTQRAHHHYETYQVPQRDKATIAFLLGCSRDKIRVALRGDDELKAAFVTGTSSWHIIEGLWAANDRPLPPNSSVRPHLRDLSHGPPDVEQRYRDLFVGDTRYRVDVALTLIDWILERLT